ncbi:glycosyl hydrolase catalytic core-domain-containing protein [Cyathus striatus]|nr:glycosyl hydrolase catalytic core-domain-containing protein [Cyathus striatus]
MAVAKLLNLFALASLAILACSYGPEPVSALSRHANSFPNHIPRGHAVMAKKKRASTSKRCKPRPTSSIAATVVQTSAAISKAPATSEVPVTSKAPVTTQSESVKPSSSSSSTAAVVTTKASTSNSNAATSSGSSSGGSGKVGLAWNNADESSIKNFVNGQVSAIYTWSPWKPTVVDSLGLEFIPMLWGEKQISDFTSLVKAGYAKTVLGFNEPNQSGQAEMTPARAAQVWKQYIQPLKNQGYSLVSPACTSAASGKTWMQEFIAACDGCTFDAIALHWYGTDPQEFITYLQDFHNTFNLPIWPTEFACQNFSGGAQCTSDQVWNFMQTVKDFMDNTSWVGKYFAFGVLHDMAGVNSLDQLLGSDGQPTALGRLYIQ